MTLQTRSPPFQPSNPLSSTRHLALSAMDKEDWDDPNLTNLQRLSKADFWEHRGSSNEPRQGNGWGEKEIRSIEAIQYLGWTEKSNETITEECTFATRISNLPTSLDANLRSQIVRSSSKGGRTCLCGGITSRSRLDWHFWSSSSRHSETSSQA